MKIGSCVRLMYEKTTSRFRMLLNHGQYQELLEETQQKLESSSSDTVMTVTCLAFKSMALMRLGDLRNAEQEARAAVRIAKKIQHPSITIEAYLTLIEASWQQGKLKEALENVIRVLSLLSMVKKDLDASESALLEGKIHFHHAVILQKRGNSRESLTHFKKAQDLLEQVKEWHYLARCLNGMGLVLWNVGQLEDARDCFERALDCSTRVKDWYSIAYAHNNLGIVSRMVGNLNVAMYHLEKSKELWSKMNNLHGVATALVNMGVIHQVQRTFDEALNCYEQSYRLYKKTGDEINLLTALKNLSSLRKLLGHFKEYRETLEEIVRIQEKKDLKNDLVTTYLNLARISLIHGEPFRARHVLDRCGELLSSVGDDLQVIYYLRTRADMEWASKNHETARKYLMKSLQHARNLGNPQEIIQMIYELFLLHDELGDREHVIALLEEMEVLAKKHPNDLFITLTFTLAKALSFLTARRFIERIKALAYLDEVLQKEGEYLTNLKVTAYLAKMRLLLDHVQMTADESCFVDVQSLLKELHHIAEENGLHPLRVELLLIKARLELVSTNFEESRRLLTVAEHLAAEKGLLNLAMKASMEHDEILELITQWREEGTFVQKPLAERIQLTGMVSYLQVSKFIRPRTVQEFPKETPVLVAIYDETGNSLYFREFTSPSHLQKQLVGSFVAALAAFSQQVFDQTLERAKMGKYNLIFQVFNSLRIFYVFQGFTYPAQQKIEKFVARIRSDAELVAMLLEALQLGRPVCSSGAVRIDQLVNETILEVS